MLLLLFIIYRCLRIAKLSRDTFGETNSCLRSSRVISFPGMVNIGVNLEALPATGCHITFISWWQLSTRYCWALV
jgi:cell division protein FtsW (lipid II flippase)